MDMKTETQWTCCNSSFHWPNHQSLFVTVANWDQLLLDIYLESFSSRCLKILSGTTSYSGQGKTTRVKLLRHLAFVFSSSYISLWSFLHQHFPQECHCVKCTGNVSKAEGPQGLFKHKPGNSAGSFWRASFKIKLILQVRFYWLLCSPHSVYIRDASDSSQHTLLSHYYSLKLWI